MLIIPRRKWHQGNLNGGGFGANRMPVSAGTARSGWEYVVAGGSVSNNFSINADGTITLAWKKEASASKYMYLFRPTIATVGKTTVFRVMQKVTWTAMHNSVLTGGFAFLNSASTSYVNMITVDVNASAGYPLYLRVCDSAGTADSGVGDGTHSLGTAYWLVLANDGTNITGKTYGTEADALADTNVNGTATVAVSAVSGTVECNRLGWWGGLSASNYTQETLIVHNVRDLSATRVVDFNDKAA